MGITMNYVNVLINIPSTRLDQYFTYQVPGLLQNQIDFGKRVLVELGRRRVEGFVIGEVSDTGRKDIKPIIEVLDVESVVDRDLYNLAVWIAGRYVCPVSKVLNAMLPPALNRKKGQRVIPLMNDEQCRHVVRDDEEQALMDTLLQKGSISLQEARKIISPQIIEQMAGRGLIRISGLYSGYRNQTAAGMVIRIGTFDLQEDMPKLRKKAPRQAEIMQTVIENGTTAYKVLSGKYPASSIAALLQKGCLIIERPIPAAVREKHILNREQQAALEEIKESILKRKGKEFLLYGITGSGKTEVYLQAAQLCLEDGQTVLVLVPEVALTRHLVDIFMTRVPDMAVLHSRMPAGERHAAWARVKAGEARLVLGTRSAVFAPLPGPGLIILDEEQETSYKQEQTPRYHAREVARQRAQLSGATVLLGSATPSLETFFRTQEGKTKLLRLEARPGGSSLPLVIVEDMRRVWKKGHNGIIGPTLASKLEEKLQRKEQSILFINRRGYSTATICRECGSIVHCPRCSVGLTYHLDIGMNVCHYCNYQSRVQNVCTECGSRYLQMGGYGTQKVEEEIKKLFPGATIARLDMDSSRLKGAQKDILNRMEQKQIDILIGTQMVAKGLDFPDVSLVGILDADRMLGLPDYQAGERTFQLIVQAAGRAGRRDLSGEVVVQTYNPDHPVIEQAVRQDYLGFYEREIEMRKLLEYPPFTRLLRAVAVSGNEKKTADIISDIFARIYEIIDAKEDDISIMGPAPCPLYKISNQYRQQLLVKCSNIEMLTSIGRYIKDYSNTRGYRIEVDIDPATMM